MILKLQCSVWEVWKKEAITHQLGTSTSRLAIVQFRVYDTGACFVQSTQKQRIVLEGFDYKIFVLVMNLQHVFYKLYVNLEKGNS